MSKKSYKYKVCYFRNVMIVKFYNSPENREESRIHKVISDTLIGYHNLKKFEKNMNNKRSMIYDQG